MLSRGLYDAMSFWPAVFWPLIFTSCLIAIVRICQDARMKYGYLPLDNTRRPDALILYLFFPTAAVFEVTVHAYLIFVIGYHYVIVVIPIVILGGILLPWLLDSLPMTQYVLPAVYLGFAGAFFVLLGFADIGLLRAFNAELYGLLTGYPASL